MSLRPKELADRLGVTKAAVSQAVARGRLVAGPDGSIDPEHPQNKEFLRRWTLHRGKSRPGFSAGGPERAVALLERAVAAYARRLAEYKTRRAGFFPKRYSYAWLDSLACGIRDKLKEFPAMVNWEAQPFEIELERVMVHCLKTGKAAADPKNSILYDPPAEVPEAPLPETVEGMDLDRARACLDRLAARKHDFERWVSAGSVISDEEVRRIIGRFGGDYVNTSLVRFPRRVVAQLAAVWSSAGLDAAKAELSRLIADEVARLDGAILKIQEEGSR